jgi:hypothetical protein
MTAGKQFFFWANHLRHWGRDVKCFDIKALQAEGRRLPFVSRGCQREKEKNSCSFILLTQKKFDLRCNLILAVQRDFCVMCSRLGQSQRWIILANQGQLRLH